MAVPALVYVGVVGGDAELMRGWAIPAATDIAFAMGVLGLLGNRCPASLRLFLLTVAIVDDIGAVMVIALFYTAQIKLGWLAAAGGVVVAMMVLNKMRVARYWPYILLALVLWYFVLNSGIHATIAGVVAALCIPMVGPDDLDCYVRIQQGAEASAIEWIDMHRHYGREEQQGEQLNAVGTSDLALRNQYLAWLDYMTETGAKQ